MCRRVDSLFQTDCAYHDWRAKTVADQDPASDLVKV